MGGAEEFGTPIFEQAWAAVTVPEPHEVVLIFKDDSRVSWQVDDPRALPFVLIAASLRQSSPSPEWPTTTA